MQTQALGPRHPRRAVGGFGPLEEQQVHRPRDDSTRGAPHPQATPSVYTGTLPAAVEKGLTVLLPKEAQPGDLAEDWSRNGWGQTIRGRRGCGSACCMPGRCRWQWGGGGKASAPPPHWTTRTSGHPGQAPAHPNKKTRVITNTDHPFKNKIDGQLVTTEGGRSPNGTGVSSQLCRGATAPCSRDGDQEAQSFRQKQENGSTCTPPLSDRVRCGRASPGRSRTHCMLRAAKTLQLQQVRGHRGRRGQTGTHARFAWRGCTCARTTKTGGPHMCSP